MFVNENLTHWRTNLKNKNKTISRDIWKTNTIQLHELLTEISSVQYPISTHINDTVSAGETDEQYLAEKKIVLTRKGNTESNEDLVTKALARITP